MPFEKEGQDSYRSPSGRKYTGKQVRMYHANDGFPGRKGRKGKRSARRRGRR